MRKNHESMKDSLVVVIGNESDGRIANSYTSKLAISIKKKGHSVVVVRKPNLYTVVPSMRNIAAVITNVRSRYVMSDTHEAILFFRNIAGCPRFIAVNGSIVPQGCKMISSVKKIVKLLDKDSCAPVINSEGQKGLDIWLKWY